MKWTIEYFEQEDTTQPAEIFENALDVKRTGQSALEHDLKKAFTYWQEYQRTRHVSPVREGNL
jgi:hypothetical protein